VAAELELIQVVESLLKEILVMVLAPVLRALAVVLPVDNYAGIKTVVGIRHHVLLAVHTVVIVG
jgi:hypothetical protein